MFKKEKAELRSNI